MALRLCLAAALVAATAASIIRVPVQKGKSLRDIAKAMKTQAPELQATADVTISDFQNAQYYGPITLGGQDFTVIFGTPPPSFRPTAFHPMPSLCFPI